MNIGIVGGGQLAKMLILAGYPMGQKFTVLDPAADAAAGQVAEQIIGDYDNPSKLQQLAQHSDVITFDFENVPASALQTLAANKPIFPSIDALAASQDRHLEKTLFQSLTIPTADYRCVDSLQSLRDAVTTLGLPVVLKTRRLGYDGKGQWLIRQPEDIEIAWNNLGQAALIAERLIDFAAEVSLIAVRGQDGATAFYPMVLNVHKHGILRLSTAPYASPALQQQAEQYLQRLLDHFDYVGVLTVEFFVHNDQLIANEMAPRVHNTGHWTIEGAGVSQFENHLRAISGLPLGSTEAHSYAAMINFISTLPTAKSILSIPGCHFHDYGKLAKPNRKLGHATLRASSDAKLQQKITAIMQLIAATD